MASAGVGLSGNDRLRITTSWDDGHPLDFRIAELLAKYELPGTFYVPFHNSRPTMSPAQIRELASAFEIGAHTVNHVRLTQLTPIEARQEIENSKKSLENILGKKCSIFCFPGGRYESVHLRMVREAGFCGARTTQLLSLQHPHLQKEISIIPTTIQVFPHGRVAYLRNAIKRGSLEAMWHVFLGRHSTTWPELAELLLGYAARVGGVFHLWGHSWEIDEFGQWHLLDQMLASIARYKQSALMMTNTGLCQND